MKKEIKVIPSSKKQEIIEKGNEFIVRVKEPAEKGKTNKALIKFLSKYFHTHVKIVSGLYSRKKTVEIE